jgi:hypothetical protein
MAFRYRAQARLRRGDDPLPLFREAERFTDEAIRRSPDFWTAWRNRGRIRYGRALWQSDHGEDSRDELRAADDAFARAFDLMPAGDICLSRGDARFRAAVIAERKGERPKACDEFRVASDHYRKAALLDPELRARTESSLRDVDRKIAELTPK